MRILLFLLIVAQAEATSMVRTPSSTKDALGRTVLAPASRVVALSPALTEIIYSLSLQDKLIGVSDYSDYPVAAKQKTNVGPYTKPSFEKIFSLSPDLVLIPIEGSDDAKKRLDDLKIPYAVVSMRKLKEIGEAGARVAEWMGSAEKGRLFKSRWEKDLNNAFKTKSVGGDAKPKVLIEIQNSPLIVAGRETFLDEIVGGCGGDNVTQQSGYPRLSREILVKEKISVILLADHFPGEEEKNQIIDGWKSFPPTQKAKVLALDPDTTSRPGPRLLQGIKTICRSL